MKPVLLAVAAWVCSFGPAFADDVCPNGAIYKVLEVDKTVIARRFGLGKSAFAPGGPPIPGMALDLVSDTGESWAIAGPMRSSMFHTDPDTLTKAGYRWEPVHIDPDSIYAVLTDDGQTQVLHWPM